MSGTIRFDDEHLVKFTLDVENKTISLEITDPDNTYTRDVVYVVE